jgi:hypothetical protein
MTGTETLLPVNLFHFLVGGMTTPAWTRGSANSILPAPSGTAT